MPDFARHVPSLRGRSTRWVLPVASACVALIAPACRSEKDSSKKDPIPVTDVQPDEKLNPFREVLQRMEPGSVIKDLLIPRYDPNKQLTMVVRAKRVGIESLDQINAIRLSLHVLDAEKTRALGDTYFSINSCIYNLTTSLLRSDDAVQVVAQNLVFHSQGLITDVGQDQPHFTAYFPGPISGFLNPSPPEHNVMKSSTHAALMATMLATAHAPAQQPAAEKSIYSVTGRSAEIDAKLKEFAALHSITIAPISLDPLPLDTTQPLAPAQKMPAFTPAIDAVGFACKGGMFFHSATSSLTLLQQVTVRDPDYAMTVDGEVKVLFAPKETKAKEEAKKAANEKKKSSISIGKVSHITGKGGVAFEATDKDGVKNFASGDEVSYNASTRVVRITGRKLIFQKGAEGRFESQNPNAFLEFNKDTKEFETSAGWNGRFSLPPQ